MRIRLVGVSIPELDTVLAYTGLYLAVDENGEHYIAHIPELIKEEKKDETR